MIELILKLRIAYNAIRIKALAKLCLFVRLRSFVA